MHIDQTEIALTHSSVGFTSEQLASHADASVVNVVAVAVMVVAVTSVVVVIVVIVWFAVTVVVVLVVVVLVVVILVVAVAVVVVHSTPSQRDTRTSPQFQNFSAPFPFVRGSLTSAEQTGALGWYQDVTEPPKFEEIQSAVDSLSK